MENYIEKEGVIMSIHHEHIYQSMRVKFDDGNSYAYPLEMAKQYIVNEHRFQVDWKDWVDLKGVNTKSLANRIYPIPSQYTIEVNPKSGHWIAEEFNRIVTKHQNRNNMKNLKITVPDGYEIDKEKSTFEEIVFKPIKKELPKSWYGLGEINGAYVKSSTSAAYSNCGYPTRDENKNVFATKEQAEASLALAQLSQLREVYRDGWKPEWTNGNQKKHCIEFFQSKIDTDCYSTRSHFLSFQSAEVRDLFLGNFRDLIEQAKPLMS